MSNVQVATNRGKKSQNEAAPAQAAAPVAPAANGQEQSPAQQVTKVAAVKEAMAQGCTGSEDIQGFVKKKYGIEVQANYINGIKTQERKKAGGGGARKGTGQADTIADMKVLRDLVDTHGVEGIQAMLTFFV